MAPCRRNRGNFTLFLQSQIWQDFMQRSRKH
jgi:hypothetical protein